MKILRHILAVAACAIGGSLAPAQTQLVRNNQTNEVNASFSLGANSNRNTITWKTGSTGVFSVGSTLTVNGTFNVSPTGGTWNLAAVTINGFTGGISDGDKGDITVAESGSSMTIDNGVITNAKVAADAGIALSKLATDPLARANHTGTQSADTIVDGSTNKAYTAAEQTKLAGIATGATANTGTVTNNATLTDGNIVLGGGGSAVGISTIAVTGGNNIALGNITANSTSVGNFTGATSDYMILIGNASTGNFTKGNINVGANMTRSKDGANIVLDATAGAQNAFTTIKVAGQNDIVAGSATANFTFTGSGGIVITTNNTTNTVDMDAGGISAGSVPGGIGTLWPTASIGSPPTGFFAAGEYGTTANTALGDWSIIVRSLGTVANPTVDIAPGAVPTGTEITFSSTTTGLTNFRATTNGTDPSYTVGTAGNSVTVTANTTYEVIANKQGWVSSGIETFAYTIDPLPELTAAEIDGATLTLTYSEAVSRGGAYSNAHFDLDMTTGGSNIGVTYVSGDGTTTHVYTAATAAVNGETVDLDFTGTANSIIETGGYNQSLAAITSAAVTNSTAGGGSFLIDEQFETATVPPSGWSQYGTATSITSGAIVGTRSIQTGTTGDPGAVWVTGGAFSVSEMWVKLRMRIDAHDGTASSFVIPGDGSLGIYMNSTRNIVAMGGTSSFTTDALPLATDLYIWMRCKKGTGANSEVEVWWNTVDTLPPSTAAKYSSHTDGTYTADHASLRIGNGGLGFGTFVYDDVKIANYNFF